MNAASSEPRSTAETDQPDDGSWSFQRRWLLIALVFTAHIGLIFGFGDRKPVTPRRPASSLVLSMVRGSDELSALNDPTLFALPHRKGFAGQTWLKNPVVTFQPFRWTEPPRLLSLPVEELGAVFTLFKQANAPAPFEFDARSPAALAMPVAPEIGTAFPARSTLHIAGDLKGRRLLNPPELRSWPATDLLTNTVVQVLVGADGRVMSWKQLLLPSGSGSPEADQHALNLARAARFDPLRTGSRNQTLGLMIFEWHTVPLSE